MLRVAYDASNRINHLTDPAGGLFTYTYDSQENLVSVTYPDSTTRTYLYQNTAFPHALTGIIDENGQPFATFTYDAQGRAVSSQHAGGVEKVTLTFDTEHSSTTVTDALGTPRTYDYQTILGVARPSTATQPCPGCGSSTTHTEYDANGNVALVTDYNGNETAFTYDLTRNLETQRVEAANTPQQRTIATAWHPTFRLITRVAEPLRITTYVYDDTGSTCGAQGALCSKTLQATTDTTGAQGFNATQTGSPRVWRYTYNSNGQVVTVDGPRTDVTDITTLTYDTQGNLTTITNALRHVTRITAYDVHGKPLTMKDPNGLVTTLTYDTRQRLTSRTVGTETTTYAYDGVGQLTKVTLPDGSFLTHTYDAAHRLTHIQDSVGNKIVYTLDAIGNRIQEQVFDPSNTLTQTRSRIFDALSRLAQSIGAQSQPTVYQYDPNSNLTGVTDPLNQAATSSYDALNRLVQLTDPNHGNTRYAYNGRDQLVSVTDPRNLTTHYSYTDLKDLTQTVSPDTGTTQKTYDEAGNLLTSTDAKGQTTLYTYDALNRVTQIAFAGGTTHTYQYDQGDNGLGRLTRITDNSSTTGYVYDQHGRVLTERRKIGGTNFVTHYRYNAAGQLIAMTYPSGRVLGFAYDQANRVVRLALDGQPLLTAIAYQPFGKAVSWTFGNGAPYTRTVDLDGRIDTYTLGTDTRTLIYDPASRIVGFSYSNVTQDQTFDYDALDRLTQFIATSTTQGYAYDATGNRISQTIGAQNVLYQIVSSSNQLQAVNGIRSKTYTYW
jgi:YD repeat-containing protein